MDPRAQVKEKISKAIQAMPANSARLSAMALTLSPEAALQEIQGLEHYHDYQISEAESKELTVGEVKSFNPPLHIQAQQTILTKKIESEASLSRDIAINCENPKDLQEKIKANPQNYGLPVGLEYKNFAEVPVTDALLKKALKITLTADINGLPASAELQKIAECKGLDQLADLINSKKIYKAPIAAAELDQPMLQNAQAKVIPWMLKELKEIEVDDLTVLVEVASSANKADLAKKLTNKKFLKEATIEEKVLSDDIIKDAQIRVLRKIITGLDYGQAHLREIASRQNPQAVATYLTGKILGSAEIKPEVLSPTVVQETRKKLLNGLITALQANQPAQLETLTSIAQCADPSALVTLINDKPTKFDFNPGTVIAVTDVPDELIKNAKARVAKNSLADVYAIGKQTYAKISKNPIYARDFDVNPDCKQADILPLNLEQKSVPASSSASGSVPPTLAEHLRAILTTHLPALQELIQASSSPQLLDPDPKHICTLLASLHNPQKDKSDIIAELNSHGIRNTHETGPAALIASIAARNEQTRQAFQNQFQKQFRVSKTASNTSEFKFYVGVANNEKELLCLTKNTGAAVVNNVVSRAAANEKIVFAVIPKAAAAAAEGQEQAQAILAFYHSYEKDALLKTQGQKRSSFCLRGTWSLDTFIQTLECGLANGKTFTFSDTASPLVVKDNTGELLKFSHNDKPEDRMKKIEDLINSKKSGFLHSRTSTESTKFSGLKELYLDNQMSVRQLASGVAQVDMDAKYRPKLQAKMEKLENTDQYDFGSIKGLTTYTLFQTAARTAAPVIDSAQMVSNEENKTLGGPRP